MKTISLTVAAAAILLAGATTGFAAELPSYEAGALPISPVQVSLLGGAHVEEQAPVAASSASPHQLGVLTPRAQLHAAAAGRTVGAATR